MDKPEPNHTTSAARNVLAGPVSGQAVQAGSIDHVHFHAHESNRQDDSRDRRFDVPAQLPMRPRRFVGRDDELATLRRWQADHADEVLIVVLSGPGGVGKSSLAVRWLHEMSNQFHDGTLFINLGGDPTGPVPPGRALEWFLESLGVPSDRIPADTAQRAALFRTVTAGQHLAMCLDNAVSATQVRALLPAGSANVVVVTSRSRLTGLAMDGALFLDVEPLDEASALTVLEGLIGVARVAEEVDASRLLVKLCGRLPLALSVAGARLAARPRRRLSDEAGSLVDDGQRLAMSVTGDQPVGAVFTASYLELDEQPRWAYRACAGHPGREFSVTVVAATLEWDVTTTRDVFAALVDVNLLVEVDDERYVFHDLLRAHASQCAQTEDGAVTVTHRTQRMASWYLMRAVAADLVIHPLRPHVGPLYQEGHRPDQPFDGEDAALSWLNRERDNLRSVVDYAWEHGWDDVAWQMCEALWGYFLHTRRYGDWVVTQTTGIASAKRCGNLRAEARLRSQLGFAYAKVARFDDAIAENTRALEIADAVGDKQARATALSQLGRAARGKDDLPGALSYYQRSRQAHEELGRERGVALNRRRTGDILTMMGDLEAAIVELRAATDMMAALGDRTQYARCLQFLSVAYRRSGNHDLAHTVLREAWAAVSEIDSSYYQAEVLAQLGELAEQRGDRAGAIDAYQHAGELYEIVEDPRADLMRSRVSSLATA